MASPATLTGEQIEELKQLGENALLAATPGR